MLDGAVMVMTAADSFRGAAGDGRDAGLQRTGQTTVLSLRSRPNARFACSMSIVTVAVTRILWPNCVLLLRDTAFPLLR